MATTSVKECCVCFGKATIKNAFGLSLSPKTFWVECECGNRTPICDSPEQALSIWNWMNRESMPNDLRKPKQNKGKEIKPNPNITINKINNTITEPGKKRHRRTKKEMEEARVKEALNKKHAKHR